jgi:hypothetical protein
MNTQHVHFKWLTIAIVPTMLLSYMLLSSSASAQGSYPALTCATGSGNNLACEQIDPYTLRYSGVYDTGVQYNYVAQGLILRFVSAQPQDVYARLSVYSPDALNSQSGGFGQDGQTHWEMDAFMNNAAFSFAHTGLSKTIIFSDWWGVQTGVNPGNGGASTMALWIGRFICQPFRLSGRLRPR